MGIGNKDPVLLRTTRYQPSPSNAAVIEAQSLHLIRIIDISQIDEDRGFQQLFDVHKIQTPKLIPLCRQDQRIRPPGHIIGIFSELYPGRTALASSMAAGSNAFTLAPMSKRP